MNTINGQRRSRIWSGMVVVLLVLGVYVFIYQTDLLPTGWADMLTSGMVVVAAIAAAVTASLVTRYYTTGTPLRLIWLHFSLALWGWAIGESIWMAEYMSGGSDAAHLSPADVFWVLSYILFILSLYRQYNLIHRPARRKGLLFLAASLAIVLVITFVSGYWLTLSNPQADRLETYVNTFYAVGDIALAIGALLIASAFRAGALGRPWLGLVVFSVSDLLYAWAETSGFYAWTIAQGNLLTTVIDTTYLLAYLVVAFGCYLQLILLSYGPRLKHDQ